MGEALYRKYRSKSLDEVVGQEHITTTLRNALKSGRISHAYLFTGPRGVGKTSIARILAHEINQLPYTKGTTVFDIIEIDGASNRRIDEIRDLRDKVTIAPVQAKYKVYIIDEVHMLTKEAFNALLKTLEEPPAHAVFILATTEVHKLPETIISRTQRFTFKPIAVHDAVKHLRDLAKKEKITISDEALELIAQHGDGSFRDSISLLDQVSTVHASGKITAEHVQDLLGLAPRAMLDTVVAALQNESPKDIAAALTRLEEQGVDATQVAKQLGEILRDSIVSGSPLLGSSTLPLLEKLLGVAASKDPSRYLEIILFETTLQSPSQIASTPTTNPPKASKPTPPASSTPKNPPAETLITDTKVALPAADATQLQELLSNGLWESVLEALKSKHNTLYGIARMAQPTAHNSTLLLQFQHSFHQKRINEDKNRKIISDIIGEVAQKDVMLRCEVNTALTPPKLKEIKKTDSSDTLGTITDIFGGGEILES